MELTEFHVPVRQVDEVPPAFLWLGIEGDVQEGLPAGALRLAAQAHPRFVRQAVGFLRVAADAGADDVFPIRFAPAVARDDVVQVQILAVEYFVAVLAGVFVPLVDVVPGEFHLLARHAVEEEQHDHARDPDLERDGVDHVPLGFPFRKVPPAGEVVCEEVAVRGVDHLRLTGAK